MQVYGDVTGSWDWLLKPGDRLLQVFVEAGSIVLDSIPGEFYSEYQW